MFRIFPLLRMSKNRTNLNRLSKEKSPYLLQHQENPVDWYPWGAEALAKAKTEQKPIFLSVGYSTCHWCHVMERESFEDEEIAKIMNQYFVNIKVDREERPDIDKVYMSFVQALGTGSGWPMSVWLTPDLKPFYGGTYFPPRSKYGRPGFPEILLQLAELWNQKRDSLNKTGEKMIEALSQQLAKAATPVDDLRKAYKSSMEKLYIYLDKSFDEKWGGFGRAPKFPRPVVFTGLLHYYKSSGDPHALQMVEFTLQKMAEGGMHDQIGGGFHRYSVDNYWHVPHFEKMLYDQAQLAVTYTEVYQITGKDYYRSILEDILQYVQDKLLHSEGGFYSAEDADSKESHDSSHKAEGAFYVWTQQEIMSLAPTKQMADVFNYFYGVQEKGNVRPESDPHKEFQGKNVLMQSHSLQNTAQKFGIEVEKVEHYLSTVKKTLYEVREKRPKPHLDDKILTSWNGLMISAFARAGAAINKPEYIQTAIKSANFIKNNLYKDGSLIRNYRLGASLVKGFVDDYAFMITALLDLYEATLDLSWLSWALELQNRMTSFWDEKDGAYFSVSGEDASIVLRIKEDYEGAEPSPNSFGAMNLVRLAYMLDNQKWREQAETIFKVFWEDMTERPIIVPHMIGAFDFYCSSPKQIVITGDPNSEETKAFLTEVHKHYIPNKIVINADGGKSQAFFVEHGLKFLQDIQPVDNKVTAYVCQNFTCQLPVTDITKLKQML